MAIKPKNYSEILEDILKAYGDFQPWSIFEQLDNLEAIVRQSGETDEEFKKRLNPIKCECGKEKHGFASHSTWCKKWNQGS